MKEFFDKYLTADVIEIIKGLIPIVLVFIVGILVIKVIAMLIKKIIKKSKIDKSLHSFIVKSIKAILYFMMILIIADMLGIPITSLIAAFSVVGLAFSLSLQDALGNLASGVLIMATHPFKSGEYISTPSADGTVKSISFSHTKLITPDNKLIHIPNKEVINATIINYTELEKRRLDITFNLSYTADANKIKEIMRARIDSDNRILKDDPIFVRTTAFQESGIDYTLRVWVKCSEYWDVYFDLLENIKADFDANGIEIPYNQLDVHVHNS